MFLFPQIKTNDMKGECFVKANKVKENCYRSRTPFALNICRAVLVIIKNNNDNAWESIFYYVEDSLTEISVSYFNLKYESFRQLFPVVFR